MSAVEIPEGLEDLFQQTWFDHVLHYGLLIGAVFQLICIAAIVVIPPREEQFIDSKKDQESSTQEDNSKEKDDIIKGTGTNGNAGSVGKKASSKKARKRK